jgi:serine/threonine protein phosphatase PrpC
VVEPHPHTCSFEDMTEPRLHAVAGGRAAVFTTRRAGKESPNEDVLAIIAADGSRGAIIVADGFGGQPAGDRASRLAVGAVAKAIKSSLAGGGELQPGILAGFDQANQAVREMGVGAATTLAVLDIDGATVRPYHVGDSEVLIVGQRGRIKLRTISHSPVGYGVEAGVLDQEQALHHEDRHVVSNMVGSEDMRIDVGPAVRMCARDSVVIASDGLFDNLVESEIVGAIRSGDLLRSTGRLIDFCRARMAGEIDGPSKPDDLTVAVFRLPANRPNVG